MKFRKDGQRALVPSALSLQRYTNVDWGTAGAALRWDSYARWRINLTDARGRLGSISSKVTGVRGDSSRIRSCGKATRYPLPELRRAPLASPITFSESRDRRAFSVGQVSAVALTSQALGIVPILGWRAPEENLRRAWLYIRGQGGARCRRRGCGYDGERARKGLPVSPSIWHLSWISERSGDFKARRHQLK